MFVSLALKIGISGEPLCQPGTFPSGCCVWSSGQSHRTIDLRHASQAPGEPQPTALQATGGATSSQPLARSVPRLEGRKRRWQGVLSMSGNVRTATSSRNQVMQVFVPPGNVSKTAFLQGACVSTPGRFILLFLCTKQPWAALMFKSRTQWQELKPVPRHLRIISAYSSGQFPSLAAVRMYPRSVLGLRISGPHPRPLSQHVRSRGLQESTGSIPKALRQWAVQGPVLQAPISAGLLCLSLAELAMPVLCTGLLDFRLQAESEEGLWHARGVPGSVPGTFPVVPRIFFF